MIRYDAMTINDKQTKIDTNALTIPKAAGWQMWDTFLDFEDIGKE